MKTSLPNQPSLADRYAEAIQPIGEAETDSFFYTRLMAKRSASPGWQMPVRPAWIVAALFVLLIANGWMLFLHREKPVNDSNNPSGIVAFVNTYYQGAASNY